MMKDTIRVLVSWECNMRCSYCCNKLPEVRSQIKPAHLEGIDFARYQTVCITGGEPLLYPTRVRDVCQRVPIGKLIVLYTNGIRLTGPTCQALASWGVSAINVGLHLPATFDWLIDRVRTATAGLGLNVRFHVQDVHRDLAARFPTAEFRFWKMDDCGRENEDRVVLTE